MKILFLVNELLTVCGVSNHVFHLAQGMKSLYPENEYYVVCGDGNDIDKFLKLGMDVKINKKIHHQSRNKIGFVQAVFNIRKFIKEHDIDIVHSHHHYAANIARFASKFTKTKTILTNHGLIPEIGLLNHFNADHIIAVNEHVVDYLKKNSIKKDHNFSLVRYGFPLPDCSQSKRTKIRVIAGGRFVYEKGFDLYIRAISELPDYIKNFAEFYFAGAGEEEANLVELNSKLNAGIIFLGDLSNFQETLCGMSIFVNSTRSRSEGFPTVLIEAGLANNLVISSDFNGHDSILNETNSIIFTSNQQSELTNAIKTAVEKFDELNDKIKNLHKTVAEKFGLQMMVNKINNLYLDVSNS